MTIEAFDPTSIGTLDTGVLVGGGDKVTAVTDAVDTTYIGTKLSGALQESYFVDSPGDRAVTIDADPDIDMRVQHDQPGPFTGSAQPGFSLDGITFTRGVGTGDLNNTVWQDLNSGPILRPTGGTWTPLDLRTVELGIFPETGFNTGTEVRYSKVSYNVNFSLTPGAFLVMMSCWIPPLMAVASHGLIYRDITQFFRRFKSRPSNRQEYEAILRELFIRPVFV